MKKEIRYFELTFTGGSARSRRQSIECIAATVGISLREFKVNPCGWILKKSIRAIPAKVHPQEKQ